MATKDLIPYAHFVGDDIKTRADFPDQADMTVNVVSDYVECSDLNITKLRAVLGSSSYQLGVLSTYASVNKWSGFSPHYWEWNDPGFSYGILTPHAIGEFAGYNHAALAPYNNGDDSYELVGAPSETVTGISVGIDWGEIDWESLDPKLNAVAIEFLESDGVSWIADFSQLIDMENGNTFSGISFYYDESYGTPLKIRYYFREGVDPVDGDYDNVPTDGGGGTVVDMIVDFEITKGYPAYVDLFTAVSAEYPNAVVDWDTANITNGTPGTYVLDFVILDDDGGDELTGSDGDWELFAKLNDASFQQCFNFNGGSNDDFSPSSSGIDLYGNLPFSLANGDKVDFEVRWIPGT